MFILRFSGIMLKITDKILLKITNNNNTRQKNWEIFEIMKKNSQNYRQISVISAKSDYFQLDSAVVII